MADDTRAMPELQRSRDLIYAEELAPGELAGEYEILGTIAAGGCGRVYSAEHRVLRRRAAVKVLHPEMAASAEAVQRFVREARTVNVVRHPNIVDVYEYGQLADGRPYYVMEFLEGLNLDAYLRARGTLSPVDALELIEPVCSALTAAHDAGVVHRDLKASNIFVARSGLPWRVKLLDFGVAKLLHPEPGEPGLTSAEHRLGTPIAMAPEQIMCGPVDARTDVYAMGVLVYYLLTGAYPFRGQPTELERMHLQTPAPAPSQIVAISRDLDAVVLRCLEKDPARRFPSIAEFLNAFRNAVAPVRARASTDPPVLSPALALYIDLWIADAGDEMDASLLDDMGHVLDLVERRLRDAGFAIPVQTGSSILGVSSCSDHESVEQLANRVLDTAAELGTLLAARPSPDARLHINICAHTDRAVVVPAPGGGTNIGGPVMQMGTWAPKDKLPAPCMTPELAAAVPTRAGARHGDYVLLATAKS